MFNQSNLQSFKQRLACLMAESKNCLHLVESESSEQLVQWLAQTMLLNDIPFNYLVPDVKMLPVESIRFFYLDHNWMQALIDGAFSIGVHTSQDVELYTILKENILKISRQFASSLRTQKYGYQSTTVGDSPVISGLLLRSRLVSDWPGLKIKGYQKKGEAVLIPVRIENLAPDVLLCLFDTTIEYLEIEEPSEGIAFGVQEQSNGDTTIELRQIVGDDAGKTFADHRHIDKVKQIFVNSENRVLDIIALKSEIEKSLSITNLMPAQFALQMVKVPEALIFEESKGVADE